MIDIIYRTLQTIINKENNGYVSPTEFNILANNVQNEIFRNYFEDVNRDKYKDNRGVVNKGYGNLPVNERFRLGKFGSQESITKAGFVFNLPEDLYLIEDDGIIAVNNSLEGNVVEEAERSVIGYLNKSISAPTLTYPVYENYTSHIIVYPSTIGEINLRYIRKPKQPKWTYFELPSGNEAFDPSNPDFQDFELHESEFSNIVIRLLSYFSITIREQEVIQTAEILKDKMSIKDNQ
jgi:hypothetical protein